METFAETSASKLDENEEDIGPSARKNPKELELQDQLLTNLIA